MKAVKHPRGDTEQESAILGYEGQLRVDLSRGTVRVHDAQRQGGFELPNMDIVKALIAQGPEGGTDEAEISYFATQAELIAVVPSPNAVAIVGEAGLEDIYVWKPGAGDGGTLTSSVDGNWHRLDSRVGFYVRLYRAGCINMQFGGAQPVANQDITAWLDGSTVKLWDGAAYLAATPVLFTRLLQKIGSYESSIILPSRLEASLVAAADLNAIAETGWRKSSAADANAPSVVVSPVFTFYTDANTAYQQFFVQTSATRDYYIRTKAAGAWGAWTFIQGTLPGRLGAVAQNTTDLNLILDSGFYQNFNGTGSNWPVNESGVLFVSRYDASYASQVWVGVSSNKVFARRYTASVWQAWYQVYPADVTNATGTLPRVNLGISTIGQAEAEAGVATTDRIWTAERVRQAIVALFATAANFYQNAATKILTPNAVWGAGTPVNLSGAMSGNVAMDFNSGLNFYGTTAGNIVFNTLSGLKDGQAGIIEITLGGAHTVGYNTASYETPRAGGLQIATGKNVIAYKKLQNGKCLLNNVSPSSG